jgi:hypothetical protein
MLTEPRCAELPCKGFAVKKCIAFIEGMNTVLGQLAGLCIASASFLIVPLWEG